MMCDLIPTPRKNPSAHVHGISKEISNWDKIEPKGRFAEIATKDMADIETRGIQSTQNW
jgi:hypothetical protein